MNFSSKLLENAVDEMSQLPGIGKRTALRLVLFLLNQPNSQTVKLSIPEGGARRGGRGRGQPGRLADPLSSRHRGGRPADRLSLGCRTQARHARLRGGGALEHLADSAIKKML